LLRLDLTPNLTVTGSLSAFRWIRAARTAGADPSIRAYSQRGVVLAPLTYRRPLPAHPHPVQVTNAPSSRLAGAGVYGRPADGVEPARGANCSWL